MNEKKILVTENEKDMVKKALENSENEKLDILSFVVRAGGDVSAYCDTKAFADGTYVKH